MAKGTGKQTRFTKWVFNIYLRCDMLWTVPKSSKQVTWVCGLPVLDGAVCSNTALVKHFAVGFPCSKPSPHAQTCLLTIHFSCLHWVLRSHPICTFPAMYFRSILKYDFYFEQRAQPKLGISGVKKSCISKEVISLESEWKSDIFQFSAEWPYGILSEKKLYVKQNKLFIQFTRILCVKE